MAKGSPCPCRAGQCPRRFPTHKPLRRGFGEAGNPADSGSLERGESHKFEIGCCCCTGSRRQKKAEKGESSNACSSSQPPVKAASPARLWACWCVHSADMLPVEVTDENSPIRVALRAEAPRDWSGQPLQLNLPQYGAFFFTHRTAALQQYEASHNGGFHNLHEKGKRDATTIPRRLTLRI